LKKKIAFGLNLERVTYANNSERDIPVETVESHKYVQYVDDEF
jgi:hypothetical protein